MPNGRSCGRWETRIDWKRRLEQSSNIPGQGGPPSERSIFGPPIAHGGGKNSREEWVIQKKCLPSLAWPKTFRPKGYLRGGAALSENMRGEGVRGMNRGGEVEKTKLVGG